MRGPANNPVVTNGGADRLLSVVFEKLCEEKGVDCVYVLELYLALKDALFHEDGSRVIVFDLGALKRIASASPDSYPFWSTALSTDGAEELYEKAARVLAEALAVSHGLVADQWGRLWKALWPGRGRAIYLRPARIL